jgi:hypothetical protein
MPFGLLSITRPKTEMLASRHQQLTEPFIYGKLSLTT